MTTTSSGPVRIGTRASALATTQSGLVADLLRERLGREVELVEIATDGDRTRPPAPARGVVDDGRLRLGAARRPPRRPGRRGRALAQDLPTYPAGASSWPPYPRARTRVTSWSPATG